MSKTNNKGFSLLELVVAVAILALVITPLLHLFVTSANLTRKGRHMDTATNAASNIMEYVKAAPSVEALAARYGLSTATSVVGGEWTTDDGRYEVKLTLDPTSEDYKAENGKSIVEYSPENLRFGAELTNGFTDEAAWGYFNGYINGLSTATSFVSMSRTITVAVREADDKLNITANFNYNYEYRYTGSVTSLWESAPTQTYLLYSDLMPPKLELYFLFYAMANDSRYRDTIIIDNNPADKPPLKMNFYLVRQNSSSPLDTAVEFLEPYSLGSWSESKMYSNLGSSKTYTKMSRQSNGMWFAQTYYFDETLLPSRQSDRIYDVTLELRDTTTGQEVTLTSTKLDAAG
ncbi:hypothetical protein FACS18949_07810 [Clostridia bacterium]|nr:hypothetical protein FACS18949_07810 [Clostridia bacterium]